MDAQAEVGEVRARDRDRAGAAQALDLRRVDGGDRLGQRGDPGRRRGARDVDVLLDRERDAVQRAGALGRGVGRIGRRARLVGQHEHDRVEVGVDGLDALEVRIDDLARGDLARGDQFGQLSGTATPQLLGHDPRLLLLGNASREPGVPTVMATILKASLISAALALALPAAASAAPEIRTVSGASPAALQATIDAFKAGAPSEINWDGVPATATFPNRFPGGFFGSQRGAEFDTPGIGTEISNGSPWGGGFKSYSGDKLFAPVGSNYANVRFNVPGTQRQAFTSSFGVVLSDVDTTGGGGRHVPGLARRDDPRGRRSRPAPTASASSASASATASASPRSRSAPVRVRSPPASSTRRRPTWPRSTTCCSPSRRPTSRRRPTPSSSRPTCPSGLRRVERPHAPPARVAADAGQVRAPQPHAEGDRRQLGRHRGRAHARQVQEDPHAGGRARPRSPSRCPANAKRGKQKLVLTAGDVKKSVTITRDLASARDARPPSRRLRP